MPKYLIGVRAPNQSDVVLAEVGCLPLAWQRKQWTEVYGKGWMS